MPSTSDAFILVAVADPVLHPEAVHAAAATTRPIVDLTDPGQGAELRRHAARAAAVLVDADFARHLAGPRVHDQVFFVASDRAALDWEAALACHADGAFLLPAQAVDLLARMSSSPSVGPASARQAAGRSLCLAVTGAAGGVGTSTFAAACARVAPGPVTLVDADPFSGGLDLLLGVEDDPGARWPDVAAAASSDGLIDPVDLREALPSSTDGIAVLSAARSTVDDPFTLEPDHVAAVTASLTGTVVVDLPVGAAPPPCDLAVLLVPAEVRPAAAAARQLKRLGAAGVTAAVVTRRRAWSGLEPGDLARILGTAPVADVATVASLPRAGETSGLPRRLPSTLRSAARAVLAEAGVTA